MHFSPTGGPAAGQVGTQGARRDFLHPLKCSCIPIPDRAPSLAVSTVLGKTPEELPGGALTTRARTQTPLDLEAQSRLTDPTQTEISTPAPAPTPARIAADPIWSLPAGARVGLGCAFLRAFFPGISASSRREVCCRPPGNSVPQPWVATLGLQDASCAPGGRAGPDGSRLETELSGQLRTWGSGDKQEPSLTFYRDFPMT